jgi:hypothetical protein
MNTTKGYKTSEFWIGTVATVGSILNQSGALGAPLPVDLISQLLYLVMSYIGGRSAIKAATNFNPVK